MNEIKLTSEQADIISCFKKRNNYDELMRCHISGWVNQSKTCLNSLTVEQFAVVLLTDSYEVKETFKVGDWVIREDGKNLYEEVKCSKIFLVTQHKMNVEHSPVVHSEGFLRHATPEEIKVERERRLWKSVGREVGEFREGDVIITRNNTYTSYLNHNKNIYEDEELLGFYPCDSFIKFNT